MMMLYRLIRLIENHSEALANCLLTRVECSQATPAYNKVPPVELKARVYEIYKHLGEWLITKDEMELELRYSDIGARLAAQGVPLSQLVWAIILTKENLWEYIKKETGLERPVEAFAELEMLEMLDLFFDRAIYYATIGYERAMAERTPEQSSVAAQNR